MTNYTPSCEDETEEIPAIMDEEVSIQALTGATVLSDRRFALPARSKSADQMREGTRAAADDFLATVREAIETLSGEEDYPTIRMTAKAVGMSVRTLQRRLAQAGATHHMLVAQARFATAAAVLERTDAKILNLALDLGYSDHANFTRAFRRWAGCAPRDYRSRTAPRDGVSGLWPASPVFGQAAPAPDASM